MLRAVSRQAPWSELNLGDAEREPSVVGQRAAPRPSCDADAVALRLLAFVNTQVMARSAPIRHDDDLEAAGVDSMGLLKILLFVEAEFGFWMPDADLRAENVSSLRRLAGYVSRRMTLA
jgi:D-alanine--poly(phosphoribitol) ligase subunit 2